MNKRGEAVTILVVIGLLAFGIYTIMTVSSDSPTGLSGFETSAITACGNISASDVLTQDISSAGTCLNITADNVIVDCQGFTIEWNSGGGNSEYAVHAQNKNNITVKNCIMIDVNSSGTLGNGILFESTNNSFILNNTIYTNASTNTNGIRIDSSSSNNLIDENTVHTLGTGTGNRGINIGGSSNIFSNNVVTTNGTTNNQGFLISGSLATNNQFTNNRVTTFGTLSSNSGFFLSATSFNNFTGNNISTMGSGSNYGFGLSAQIDSGSNNNRFENNIIQTNGTSGDNYGFSIDGSSNGYFANNVISTSGNGGNNHGVNSGPFTHPSTNHTFFNNTINTDSISGSGSFGMKFLNGNNNSITFNTIFADGEGDGNKGIHFSGNSGGTSDRNLIDNNVITTNSRSGFTGQNIGIHLDGSVGICDNNNITNNNITTNHPSAGENKGIFLDTKADKNIVSGNIISTSGDSSNSHGIELFARKITGGGPPPGGGGASVGFETQSPNPALCAGGSAPCESVSNNWVYQNTITTNGTSESHGIKLRSATHDVGGGGASLGTTAALNSQNQSVSGNLIQNNVILSTGGSGMSSDGINLEGITSSNDAIENEFDNNDIFNTSRYGVNLVSSSSGSTFNDTRIVNASNWINGDPGTSNSFANTTFETSFGSINISGSFTLTGAESILKSELDITSNKAFLNSSSEPYLNQSARITLNGISSLLPNATVDFDDDGSFVICNSPQCIFVSFNGSTFVYDVASFTSYSSLDVGGVNITISKSDSPEPVSPGSQLNYTIVVNVTSGTATNVTVNESYPANVVFDSSSPAPSSGDNIFSLGNLVGPTVVEINITVNVSGTASGVLTNSINVTFQNSTGSNLSLSVSENTTVISPSPPSGGGGGGGGSGGSGGVICPPLCQYPENANLPICINNCVRTEPAEFPAAQFPSFGEAQDSSSGVDTSAGLPEPESQPIVEETVEIMEETPAERSGFAKFFPWLVLLVLIALLIAIISRNRDGGKSHPVVKVVPHKAAPVKSSSKETQKILDDIRKSEERLKKLLGK